MSTISQAASHLDMSERRFRELLDETVITRAPRGEYDLDAVRRQYIGHLREVAAGRQQAQAGDLDPAQERARKDRALAIATELKNDLAIGKVVLIDDAMAAVTVQHMKLRNKLLSLPSRIASRIPEKGRAQVFTLVEAEVLSAMAELTTGGEGHVTPAEVATQRSLTASTEEPAHG
ncbi:hypothetical protein [Methylobacterium sp.]|jgi:phage terminase Nu1 subunit (DNA packaging protein)|uniref:hypothetical protein n=1 Tax=Methylobacterium sp. TaxID=409 RepID=UPI0025F4807F|nr:hypothetical protein [Methylobacterium sp.]MBY0256342.1 hypothetical protein [Methylobacterium sp.]